MATMKVLLRKRNIKGKAFPIIIKVRHKRKQGQFTIPNISVEEKHWDKDQAQIKDSSRRDPMYNRAPVLNSQINNYKRKVETAIDELHLSQPSFLQIKIRKKENDNQAHDSRVLR